MSQVRISRVNRPRGLKGELKCDLFDRIPKKIFIGDREYTVKKAAHTDSTTYLYLDGVDSIDVAERLRGREIFAERAEIALLADEVLTSDLVGFDVVDEKNIRLGCLLSLDDYGGGHICVCDFGSFPYEDHFVAETNMLDRKIVVKNLCFDNSDSAGRT